MFLLVLSKVAPGRRVLGITVGDAVILAIWQILATLAPASASFFAIADTTVPGDIQEAAATAPSAE